MDEWRVWKTPDRKHFRDQESYEKYIERARCGICHEKFKDGEKFKLAPVHHTKFSKFTAVAVLVHKRCCESE